MSTSRIYQSLPVKDGLVFGVVFSERSILDISPIAALASITGTPQWHRRNGVEMVQNGSADYISLAHNVAQQWTTGSLFIRTDPLIGDATERRFLFKRAGAGQFDYKHTATALTLFCGGTNSSLNTTTHIGKRTHGVSIAGGGKAQFWVDGVHVGEGVLVATPGVDTGDILIGNGFANNLLVPIQAALGYSRVLTAEEWSRNHAWSESLRSPSLPHDRRYFDMGSLVPHGSAGGEVGSWDLGRSTGRTEPDKSGQGNHATLEGACAPVVTEMGRALSFDGVAGYVDIGATGQTVKSVEMVAKIAGNGKLLDLDGGTHTLEVSGGSLVAAGFVAPTYYVDGEATAVAPVGWHHIAVTTDTGIPATDLDIGRVGAVYGSALVKGVVIYSDVRTPAEIKADYQPIRDKVMYKLDLSQVPPTLADVTAGEVIPGTDYTVRTGTWAADENTARPYIENVVAGLHTRQQPDSFGSYRFKFNKAAGSDLFWVFIASAPAAWNDGAQNGYQLQVDNTEKVALQKVTAGVAANLFVTGIDYVVAGTDYEILITRTTAGVFKAYILGGAYTAWTLIDTSAADVTHVTSAFAVTEADAGDLTNLKDEQYQGVITP